METFYTENQEWTSIIKCLRMFKQFKIYKAWKHKYQFFFSFVKIIKPTSPATTFPQHFFSVDKKNKCFTDLRLPVYFYHLIIPLTAENEVRNIWGFVVRNKIAVRYVLVQKASVGVNLQYRWSRKKRKWKSSDNSNISTRQLLRGGRSPLVHSAKNNSHSAGIEAAPQNNTHTQTLKQYRANGNKHETVFSLKNVILTHFVNETEEEKNQCLSYWVGSNEKHLSFFVTQYVTEVSVVKEIQRISL